MKTFSTVGPNGYTLCEIAGGSQPVGQMSANTAVAEGTPFLLAAIFDPATGARPDPAKVRFTVTQPDGTVLDTATNTPGLFVAAAGGSTYAVCVVQPTAGRWEITVRCGQAAAYRANLVGLPSADPLHSALAGAGPYYPNVERASAHQYLTDLFGWTFHSLAVVLAAAGATPGLQLAPVGPIERACGLSAQAAQALWAAIVGRPPPAAAILLAQSCSYAYPDAVAYALPNGEGEAGLAGWTIIANGGQGWSVQRGFANPIQYASNFAVSDGWCKKSQTIDLVQQTGFAPAYLDQAPRIEVLDWIAVGYPTASATPSQYYLTVELRDANQVAIKSFQTGAFPIRAAAVPGELEWRRVGCYFANYGPGVRYIHFEHGGLDAQQYAPQYGLKITGAEADVAVAIPQDQPKELIQNGSGQNGLAGWNIIGSTPWTVETGPGRWCPGTEGTTDFAVASGTGTKSQSIDLLAAGYSPQTLDAAPLVSASQWICAESGCVCTYTLKFELRDASQRVIRSFDSGAFSLPAAPPGAAPFRYLAQNLSDYGPGLRYIYFEHSASPESHGSGMTAKIAGASVRLQSASMPHLLASRSTEGREAAVAELGEGVAGRESAVVELREGVAGREAAVAELGEGVAGREAAVAEFEAGAPAPITDTTVEPYKWVCQLVMQYGGGRYFSCTGWLIPKPSANLFVVGSAAHCFKSGKLDWPTQVTVKPAQGNQGGSPYTPVTVPIGRVRVPFDWLVANQAEIGWWRDLADYAAICVAGPANWDAGGFAPTVETDAQLSGQPGTITGFPAQAPYTSGYMYTQPVTLKAWNATQISVPTDFTPGSSGGPVYVRGTSKVVGAESYGPSSALGSFLYSDSATRINAGVAADIARWSTPLKPTDRVTKLQMVIRTGLDWGAGTDDDIVCTIDGKGYELERLWTGGSSWYRTRNEPGDYDGYDLTPRLKEHYPNGIELQYLLGKTYLVKRVIPVLMYHTLVNGDWEVESVAIYVNDQLLCVDNFNSWVLYDIGSGSGSVVGTFTLS